LFDLCIHKYDLSYFVMMSFYVYVLIKIPKIHDKNNKIF